MKPQSNKAARQLSSMPTAHRPQVLQAISDKAHAVSSAIVHSQAKADRLRQLFDQAPADSSSRLAWIQGQLNKI